MSQSNKCDWNLLLQKNKLEMLEMLEKLNMKTCFYAGKVRLDPYISLKDQLVGDAIQSFPPPLIQAHLESEHWAQLLLPTPSLCPAGSRTHGQWSEDFSADSQPPHPESSLHTTSPIISQVKFSSVLPLFIPFHLFPLET